MSVSLTCRNCGQTLAADDVDGLLPIVQEHVNGHAHTHGVPSHPLTREQLLTRLDRPSDGGE